MKKLKFLIPSLVTTTFMPLIGLTSCQTDNFQDYKVSEKDFENIIRMLGVDYLQVNQTLTDVIPENGNDIVKIKESTIEFSPTVYHITDNMKMNETTAYEEQYVYELPSTKQYQMIERDDPSEGFSTPVEAESEDFVKPNEFAYDTIIDQYIGFLLMMGNLTFDEQDLCYKGEATDSESSTSISLKFYFYKNKLIKHTMHKIGETPNSQLETTLEQTFTYTEVTPDVPELKYDLIITKNDYVYVQPTKF